MVSCDLAGDNLQLMFHTDLPAQVAHTYRDLPGQHLLAVFWDPHEMHLQVALRARSQAVVSHSTTVHEPLLRLKATTIPEGDTKA